jgi:hypothetical protein
MLGSSKAPGRSFQTGNCPLFHLFHQVKIRLGSPQIEEPRAGPANTDNIVIIRHRPRRQLPNELATGDLNRCLLNCQQTFMRVRQRQQNCAETSPVSGSIAFVVANSVTRAWAPAWSRSPFRINMNPAKNSDRRKAQKSVWEVLSSAPSDGNGCKAVLHRHPPGDKVAPVAAIGN